MKFKIITIGVCVLATFFLFPDLASAQIEAGVLNVQVDAAGGETGLDGETDIRVFAATLVQYFLGVLGTVFLVLIVFASYWLIIARGREDYIDKAKKTLIRAVVGMTLVLMSYGVATFIKQTVIHISDDTVSQKK